MKIKEILLILFVLMVVCIFPVSAIQHDGIFKYDTGDSGKSSGTYGMNPWGHAVLFRNKDTVTVTGIQVYGCKFGTGTKKVFIEIWDKDLKRLYRDSVLLDNIPVGQMDVNQNNCGAVASWADIPLPNHAVTGDFYGVVFTYSPKPSSTTQGMSIGFTQPSSTATSHTVTGDPNKIDEVTIVKQYDPTDIDWMIRAYYTKSAATTASTTVPTLTSRNGQTTTTTAPAASLPSMDQTSAAQTMKAESTKADIGVGLVVLSVIVSILLLKRS
jgi:hypothetical protein